MPNEPLCREKRKALGLPYPKSGCEKCGSVIRPGWRCAEEASASRGPEAMVAAAHLLREQAQRMVEQAQALEAGAKGMRDAGWEPPHD